VGPQATAHFYNRLVVDGGTLLGIRPPVLISSLQIQTADEVAYLESTGGESPSCYETGIGDAMEDLCGAGVSAIVMPCLSLTHVLERMAMRYRVRTISAFGKAGRIRTCLPGSRIGVLGTAHVRELLRSSTSGVCKLIQPPADYQRTIIEIIRGILRGVNPAEFANPLEEVCHALQSQVDVYVVACSELSLVPKPSGYEFVDSLDELLQDTIRLWQS